MVCHYFSSPMGPQIHHRFCNWIPSSLQQTCSEAANAVLSLPGRGPASWIFLAMHGTTDRGIPSFPQNHSSGKQFHVATSSETLWFWTLISRSNWYFCDSHLTFSALLVQTFFHFLASQRAFNLWYVSFPSKASFLLASRKHISSFTVDHTLTWMILSLFFLFLIQVLWRTWRRIRQAEADGKIWGICFFLIREVAEVPEGWKDVRANSSFGVCWGPNVPVSHMCPVELLPAHDDREPGASFPLCLLHSAAPGAAESGRAASHLWTQRYREWWCSAETGTWHIRAHEVLWWWSPILLCARVWTKPAWLSWLLGSETKPGNEAGKTSMTFMHGSITVGSLGLHVLDIGL